MSKLSETLLLHRYVLHLFGVTSLEALSDIPRNAARVMSDTRNEGYNENNISRFYNILVSRLFSNADQNEFCRKMLFNPLDYEWDRIYVNGDNIIENMKTGEERWKVKLIEHGFHQRMWSEAE